MSQCPIAGDANGRSGIETNSQILCFAVAAADCAHIFSLRLCVTFIAAADAAICSRYGKTHSCYQLSVYRSVINAASGNTDIFRSVICWFIK